MKTLKKHWQPVFVVVAGVVLAGALWMYRGQQASALLVQAPSPPYTAVTSADRDALQTLLDDVGLDREALVALNLTGSQAESVLAAARQWKASNAFTLSTHASTIAQKVTALRDLEAAERMGPFDQERRDALNTARTELRDARGAYQTTLGSLQTGINGELSDSQEATWAAMQKGFGQRLPLRMLDLTGDQRRSLARAERHYDWRRAAARTEEERQAAISAREAAWGQILTQDQQSVINGLANYHASSTASVNAAYDTVLEVDDG